MWTWAAVGKFCTNSFETVVETIKASGITAAMPIAGVVAGSYIRYVVILKFLNNSTANVLNTMSKRCIKTHVGHRVTETQ